MSTFAIDIRLIGKKRTGDETVFFNLTKELIALDHKHQYLLVTNTSNQEELAVIRGRLGCIGQQNVEIVSLRGKNRFIWNLLTLPWFLIRNTVDTYHTQYILPFFVPSRTKVVTHIHDVSFRAYPELIGWKDRFFLALFIPSSLRRSARIVTPSQFTKDEIVKYYSIASEKITVVPNALSTEFIEAAAIPDDEKLECVREKYHLPKTYAVYVGTLQPRKNIPFLIEAFSLLKNRLPEAKLVLVGNRTGHHVDTRLDSTIDRLNMAGDVVFPGFIDQEDLQTVIRGAQVFAFPSLYEGFGIPLLEAMSQGVPVAAADIPSLHEVAGEAALYFPVSEDTTSLAIASETLYTLFIDQNRREALIQKGKERLRAFSWKSSAEIMLGEYERLVVKH
jgi:glycosyltransferase involved in cell wall biosynthesis